MAQIDDRGLMAAMRRALVAMGEPIPTPPLDDLVPVEAAAARVVQRLGNDRDGAVQLLQAVIVTGHVKGVDLLDGDLCTRQPQTPDGWQRLGEWRLNPSGQLYRAMLDAVLDKILEGIEAPASRRRDGRGRQQHPFTHEALIFAGATLAFHNGKPRHAIELARAIQAHSEASSHGMTLDTARRLATKAIQHFERCCQTALDAAADMEDDL